MTRSIPGVESVDREASALLGRDVEPAETHLVGGAFAPEDVFGRKRRAVDHGLIGGGVVPVTFDAEAVTGAERDRVGEHVAILPVEVPLLDVEEALLGGIAACDLELGAR